MFPRIVFTILILLLPLISWAKVRTVEVKKDQIVIVRTALGIATIIQVPDRPSSLVVGDQNAYKVEYLDQAITIKPLHGGAKSNLYIYTDYRRFNVQLVTVPENIADYVVYLENPIEKPKSSTVGWKDFRNHLKNESLIFETKRIAKTPDGIFLIEFEVRSDKSEKFDPEWLWLTQSGVSKPIHSLALSSQSLSKGQAIKGVMQIYRNDILENLPLRIELRRQKISYLTVPKVSTWK